MESVKRRIEIECPHCGKSFEPRVLKCTRCKHEWLPRGAEPPRTCPKCRSPYWDVPRKNGRLKKV